MKFMLQVFLVCLCTFFLGCHGGPYAIVGAGVGAADSWKENENKNAFTRVTTSVGCAFGGFVSGGLNGFGNDLKFIRKPSFDYSEMYDPFNNKEEGSQAPELTQESAPSPAEEPKTYSKEITLKKEDAPQS